MTFPIISKVKKNTKKIIAKIAPLFHWYCILPVILWIIITPSILSNYTRYPIFNDWTSMLWVFQGVLLTLMIIFSVLFFAKIIYQHWRITKSLTSDSAIYHIMLIPCYKEPLSVIERTINSLIQQKYDIANKAILVIGFEEKTPELERKKQYLIQQYRHYFLDMEITVHPSNLPGEIPGKCSNDHWAAQTIYTKIKDKYPFLSPKQTIISSIDVDTLLHPGYLGYLCADFKKLSCEKQHATIWQAANFYNWKLANANFFTRITSLYRSIWMMGFTIPLKVHPMSVYSSSFQLCIDNHFFHPGYQMEDMYYYVSCLKTKKGKTSIRPVYLPLICAPTSGENWREELYEWGRQAHRWSVGAFEIFHCIVEKRNIIGKVKGFKLAALLFLMYGFIQSFLGIGTLLTLSSWQREGDVWSYPLWLLVTCMPFIFTLWCLLIDAAFVRIFKVKEEKVPLKKNIIDFLLSPVVFVAYNVISLFAMHHISIRGKKICQHNPCKKEALEKTSRT